MFQQIVLNNSTTLCTLVAFGIAASIFLTIAWRALRMPRQRCLELEELPFQTSTPPSRDDSA